jgi:hypothetical protein
VRVDPILIAPDLVIGAAGVAFVAAGPSVMLTGVEASILRALVPNGTVWSAASTSKYWLGRHAAARTLDVHVARLRKKLGALGQRIPTVRKVGYQYVEPAPGASKTYQIGEIDIGGVHAIARASSRIADERPLLNGSVHRRHAALEMRRMVRLDKRVKRQRRGDG